MSTDAKVLYGILLNRMDLSAKNGWLDEQGRVYIICTLEFSSLHTGKAMIKLCRKEQGSNNSDAFKKRGSVWKENCQLVSKVLKDCGTMAISMWIRQRISISWRMKGSLTFLAALVVLEKAFFFPR